MKLQKGDKYTPGNQAWFKMPRGNDIVILQDSDNREMARYDKKYSMIEIGKNIHGETICEII